jgi:hypothetical protein
MIFFASRNQLSSLRWQVNNIRIKHHTEYYPHSPFVAAILKKIGMLKAS